MSVRTITHGHSSGELASPVFDRSLARLSDIRELRAFHQEALDQAQRFTSFYKDQTGNEPRSDLLMTLDHERLIDAWLESSEGREKSEAIADRALRFVSTNIGLGHPGHDRRHVLVKDPIAGLRLALEEELNPCRGLFIIPSLLHDVGRLYEPALFGAPQSGVRGGDHAALGFVITDHVLGDELRTESGDSELSYALALLRNEILNAVLDHQSGHSRTSFIAQAVQRSDREQLVGYEMLHRSFAFDVGFHGVQVRGVKIPERVHTLALPGAADDRHLFHHIEFYMRNLVPNVGRCAELHAERGKIESGTFLWLAASPEMRAQIFAPELARDQGIALIQGKYKEPLKPHVWEAIRDFSTSRQVSELNNFRGMRSLRELAREFVHPPYASRTDLRGSENWPRIDAALNLLTPLEKRRMGDALSYGLLLAGDVAREDRRIVDEAVARFSSRPTSPLLKVALFVRDLCLVPGY
jgi:hypothetical protein